RRLSITPVQDSRVGLAGPLYGLGAAVTALCACALTGSKLWGAVAHFGAVINLFNLIPVWQLDGSRGLRSANRNQRILIVLGAAVLWMVSSNPMLFLIAIAGVFRLFSKDAPVEGDNIGLLQFTGLLVGLSVVAALAQRATQWPATPYFLTSTIRLFVTENTPDTPFARTLAMSLSAF